MKDFLAILNVLLPVVSGLGGAYIGGYFTRKSQLELIAKEMSRDENKQKRSEKIETLIVYNNIMKIDGEEILITHVGGSFNEFDINSYQEKIRPIIYEKFHLIHSDVASYVKKIDDTIARCNYQQDATSHDHNILCDEYASLTYLIEKHIENYRNQNNTNN
jgi:hypothetical protein